MTLYNHFIGIDIGKFNFVVAIHGDKKTKEYENNSSGVGEFIADYQALLANSLCVLETTGGYELSLLYTLCDNKLPVHRADTRKVKNFIRSFGCAAKTDRLDAQALAKYGVERAHGLELFKPQSQQSMQLFQLIQRRSDLKQMLVAEKNRINHPSSSMVRESCQIVVDTLSKQIEVISMQIQKVIKSDPELEAKHKILKTVPGIGDIVAFELLILLPELGKLDRRKIASLAGLAPRSNESGIYKGYRSVGHGRNGVKPILFMAAMAARNSKSELKAFYERLIDKGKKKMVALTALMRKIFVIANARLKQSAPAVA